MQGRRDGSNCAQVGTKMASHTETDRLLVPLDHPVPVIQILLTDGRCAPLSRESAPIQSVAVMRTGLLIGREVSSLQCIPLPKDRHASAQHARIWLHEDGRRVLIEDLGSKNKTFVDGQPIERSELSDRSVIRIGNSLLILRMHKSQRMPRKLPSEASQAGSLLLGQSPELIELRYQLSCAAERHVPVLLMGETGTGKDRAAQFLHLHSAERNGPFRALNCATIPHALAESMLFGHLPGSFTGALQRHSGAFRQASGGTLFLDEVGELPIEIQPKLLRALEEAKIWPVGAHEPLDCHVRVVTATNRNLDLAASRDSFRLDLLARLSMLRIELPPLRMRKEDILLLFGHYLGGSRRMTARLGEALLLYPWPQNVRELIAVTEYMKTYEGVDSDETPLDLLSLPDRFRLAAAVPIPNVQPTTQPIPQPIPHASPQPIPQANRQPIPKSGPQQRVAEPALPASSQSSPRYDESLLRRLLSEESGMIARVARRLQLSRRQVSRVLLRLGIDPKSFRKQLQPDSEEPRDSNR